jgi:hypothetical protein
LLSINSAKCWKLRESRTTHRVVRPGVYDSDNVTGADNQQERLDSYIAGYVDGEGSFSVSVQRNRSCRIGFQLVPEFHVSQNGDRAQVLGGDSAEARLRLHQAEQQARPSPRVRRAGSTSATRACDPILRRQPTPVGQTGGLPEVRCGCQGHGSRPPSHAPPASAGSCRSLSR